VITNCISIIRFSGTGKSTVAGLVADLLDWDAVDSDTAIEDETGETVPRLLTREGEAVFRAQESVTIGPSSPSVERASCCPLVAAQP